MEKEFLHHYVVEDICVACGRPTKPESQICADCQQLLLTPLPPDNEAKKDNRFSLLPWFFRGRKKT